MDGLYTIVVPAGHSAFVFPTPDVEEEAPVMTYDEALESLEKFIAKQQHQPRHSNGKPEVRKYSRGGIIGKHLAMWA